MNDSLLVSRLHKLEEAVFNHVFRMNPRQAVVLGLHEYDGLLPDASPGFIEDSTKKTVELLGRVRSESNGLDKDGKFDAMCLETMLERMLFDIQDLRVYSTRPTMYAMQLSVTPYLSREYAPIDTRIGAVKKHLAGIPAFLDQGSRNLDKTLAKPIADVAVRQMQGVLRDLDGNSSVEASKASGPVREEFTRLKNDAAGAAADFIEELGEEHSLTMDFALGRDRFQKLLWVNDRINRPVEEVLDMGLRDLESNLKAFRELAEKVGPGNLLQPLSMRCSRIIPPRTC